MPVTSTTAGAAHTYTYTDADNGRQVSAHVGDVINIDLAECYGSCGYHWAITQHPDPSVVVVKSETDKAPSGPPGQVGGSGTNETVLQAAGRGSTAITLMYYPPGSNQPPAKSYHLSFVIS